MNLIKKKNNFQKKVETLLENLEIISNEQRYEPSEKGAGTCITENGREEQEILLQEFTLEIFRMYEINAEELFNQLTFEKILEVANLENVDEIIEVCEVDTYVRDNGEEKYRYFVRVFKYLNEERFFEIEEQQTADGQIQITAYPPREVFKVTKTVTSWS